MDITGGPDGNLWFTNAGGPIGRITPSGASTSPTPTVSAASIVGGPDGNLWFTAETEDTQEPPSDD